MLLLSQFQIFSPNKSRQKLPSKQTLFKEWIKHGRKLARQSENFVTFWRGTLELMRIQSGCLKREQKRIYFLNLIPCLTWRGLERPEIIEPDPPGHCSLNFHSEYADPSWVVMIMWHSPHFTLVTNHEYEMCLFSGEKREQVETDSIHFRLDFEFEKTGTF